MELSCLSSGLALPQLYLESGALHPSGSLDKCLTSMMASGDFPQEPICGWFHSADTAVLITCAGIRRVSLPYASALT